MAASFPTSTKTFSTLVDLVDSVLAAHPNERGDEITAIETWLLNMLGSLNTWTPTLTNTTNIASSTNQSCWYVDFNKVVLCVGHIDVDPTATGLTELRASLPVASNFATYKDLAGVGARYVSTVTESVWVAANSASDVISFQWYAQSAAAGNLAFVLVYKKL